MLFIKSAWWFYQLPDYHVLFICKVGLSICKYHVLFIKSARWFYQLPCTFYLQGGFINLQVPCAFYQVCEVVTLVEIPGSVKFIVVYCYL